MKINVDIEINQQMHMVENTGKTKEYTVEQILKIHVDCSL